MIDGLDSIIYWPNNGAIHEMNPNARVQGREAWDRHGVVVRLTGDLPATLYRGELFSQNVAALVPRASSDLTPIWLFAKSKEYRDSVRTFDRALKVTTATLTKVPFDIERWREIAKNTFPNGLPEPCSDDPSQWLFDGRPEGAIAPLQVGVGRLLGYQWPGQSKSDDLTGLADLDGIVCLPAVSGELPAADRLQALLVQAYGDQGSPGLIRQLLSDAESKRKSLAEWLRDDFFSNHCKVFANRPFIWHIWDGLKDGFAALVNYHRLDRAGLEKLTYTYLGDWIERQKSDAADDVAGADTRLAAAQELKHELELILKGEPPYDIYVRWKALREQPIGWEPDLDDGVRLNIRPFVKAGILRSKFNVAWKKDSGKNPDGSERENDLHLTIDEKRKAREKVGRL
jgi:hypothetical protein